MTREPEQIVAGHAILEDATTIRGKTALRVLLVERYLRTLHSLSLAQSFIGKRILNWAENQFNPKGVRVEPVNPALEELTNP